MVPPGRAVDLAFSVLDAAPERYGAAPTLVFRLRAVESTGAAVHALALRVQLTIEPQRRAYDDPGALADLFGTPDRWATTLRPFLWTHASAMVPGFTGSTDFDLPVPCTYDFDVAAAKYLHALGDGEVPLALLFSGTVFTRGTAGFAVEQVPWHLEAAYRLPVAVWRSTMDQFFPNSGWIRLDRETLDALARYRSARGLTSWEQTIAALLPAEVPR
ncbi:MAG TPA: DUF6084 family protein [Actinoplanes sp.]|nr:DUF6084 family protein [Actinoplanes sp.]